MQFQGVRDGFKTVKHDRVVNMSILVWNTALTLLVRPNAEEEIFMDQHVLVTHHYVLNIST